MPDILFFFRKRFVAFGKLIGFLISSSVKGNISMLAIEIDTILHCSFAKWLNHFHAIATKIDWGFFAFQLVKRYTGTKPLYECALWRRGYYPPNGTGHDSKSAYITTRTSSISLSYCHFRMLFSNFGSGYFATWRTCFEQSGKLFEKPRYRHFGVELVIRQTDRTQF
jgi:hypothetical protein